jgi:ribosome-associated toxin RatA of RatAB toxin-antitoxin module
LRKVSKTAQLPYTAEQMYRLVNDVKAYPEFLPWCEQANVLSETEEQLSASVTMAAGKIKQSFTTQNKMIPGKKITVALVEGPFKHLNGTWEFIDEDINLCSVKVFMEFEFSNRIVRLAFDKVFTHIVETLLHTFEQRAQEVYGNQ